MQLLINLFFDQDGIIRRWCAVAAAVVLVAAFVVFLVDLAALLGK